MITLNVFDYFSGALLAHDLSRELDSIQLLNQCSKESSPSLLKSPLCVGFVEIWDVRALHRHVPPERKVWSSLDGGSCPLSPGWVQCLSCKDSQLERACRFRCVNSQLAPLSPEGVRYGGIGVSVEARAQGPLGIATAWPNFGMRILGRV